MGAQINWPSELHLLGPIQIGPQVVIFPLVGDGDAAGCLTLDEAQSKGKVVIEEQKEGEAVAEIDVTVLDGLPVLVLEGELLEGALQNRVVNITLLLPPGKHKVPVNCVESGRWHSKGGTRQWYANKGGTQRSEREFEATGTTLDSDIRRRKMHSSVTSMRATGRARSDQSTTWDAIDTKLSATAVSAPDSDLLDLHEERWESVQDTVQAAAPVERQVGAVVAVGGEIVAMEVFGDPASWSKVWRKVMSGYVSEGMDRTAKGPQATEHAAVAFARAAAAGDWQTAPSSVGRGVHETLDGQQTGFRLRDGGVVRHAVVFAA